MWRIAALIIYVVGAAAVDYQYNFDLNHDDWYTFKMEHNKVYASEAEERLRMSIYFSNSRMIAAHNHQYEMGLVSYTLKQNRFGDLMHHEFVRLMTGFNISHQSLDVTSDDELLPEDKELPSQVDWRSKGAVTEVKNQGQCGSCWAFAATGALESHYFIKTRRLISLSEQNLIDCSRAYGNNGCNGGNYFGAYNYIRDNRGIDTEQVYPYEARNGMCRYRMRNSGVVDSGYVWVSKGNEYSMKVKTAKVGPLAVSISAADPRFQFYHTGVYYNELCSKQVNHAVLVVGYGVDQQGGNYWLVKNSWGRTWGDRGYVKMARDRCNHCGIATFAAYPKL